MGDVLRSIAIGLVGTAAIVGLVWWLNLPPAPDNGTAEVVVVRVSTFGVSFAVLLGSFLIATAIPSAEQIATAIRQPTQKDGEG